MFMSLLGSQEVTHTYTHHLYICVVINKSISLLLHQYFIFIISPLYFSPLSFSLTLSLFISTGKQGLINWVPAGFCLCESVCVSAEVN